MALTNCPECGKKVWSGAASCPSCAYPIDSSWEHTGESYRRPTPLPAKQVRGGVVPGTPVQTTYHAMKQIAVRIATGGALFASGVAWEAPPVIIISLLMGASCFPIWWHARKTAFGGAEDADDLRARIEDLEREWDDRQLRQMEDFQDRHTQHLAELEERLDFAERLLTKQKEEGAE